MEIMGRTLLLLCQSRYDSSHRDKAFNEDVKMKVEAM